MRPGPKPLPQPSPLWSTFRPETHRHLVLLWTDLLQRQLPAARGRAHVPGEPCHGHRQVNASHNGEVLLLLGATVYAAASAPVTSAQIANACARTARYSVAGR